LKLFEQAMGSDYQRTLPKSDEDQLKDSGEQIWDSYKESYWAIGVDPADVEETQARLKDSPDCLITNMFLRDINEKMKHAQEVESPENLAFLARRNKLQHQAKEKHKELGEEKSALFKKHSSCWK
jgi:hypothetical protein